MLNIFRHAVCGSIGKRMAKTSIKTWVILISCAAGLMSFGWALLGSSVLEMIPIASTTLSDRVNYLGASVLIYLLGLALGFWSRARWIILAVLVVVLITEHEVFFSQAFGITVSLAPLLVIAFWVLLFPASIVFGFWARVREASNETKQQTL